MKKITLDYCGMTATGATVKEAKENAARALASAMAKDYTPRFYECIGKTGVWQGLIWATPTGYCYRVWLAAQTPALERGYTSSGPDLGEAVRSVKCHLADCAVLEEWEAREYFKGAPGWFRDWQQKDLFRRCYQEAIENGLSSVDAHSYACEESSYSKLDERVSA